MTSLLSLPAEILEQIAEHAYPDSFENFLMTNKKVYLSVGRDLLQSYNAFCRSYHSVRYSEHGIPAELEFLEAIKARPVIRRCVRTVNFNKRDLGVYVASETEMKTSVVQSLKDTLFLARTLEDKLISGFSRATPTMALLLLLPNLEDAILAWDWDYVVTGDQSRNFVELWAAIDAMVMEMNKRKKNGALGYKLKTVRSWQEPTSRYLNHLYQMMPFMALQSVEELHTGNASGLMEATKKKRYRGPDVQVWKWRYPGVQSSLRVLTLAASMIDPACIADVTSHMPQLEVFRYSHQVVTSYRTTYKWSVGVFVGALAKNVGETLKELAISINSDLQYVDYEEAVTLKNFTKLERVEIDLTLFMGLTTPGLLEMFPVNVRTIRLCALNPGLMGAYHAEAGALLYDVSLRRDRPDCSVTLWISRDVAFEGRSQPELDALKEIANESGATMEMVYEIPSEDGSSLWGEMYRY